MWGDERRAHVDSVKQADVDPLTRLCCTQSYKHSDPPKVYSMTQMHECTVNALAPIQTHRHMQNIQALPLTHIFTYVLTNTRTLRLVSLLLLRTLLAPGGTFPLPNHHSLIPAVIYCEELKLRKVVYYSCNLCVFRSPQGRNISLSIR